MKITNENNKHLPVLTKSNARPGEIYAFGGDELPNTRLWQMDA